MKNDRWTDKHHGETVYVIGKGPSLRGFNFEPLRGRAVIVVNSAEFWCPIAPYWIFFDNHRLAERPDLFEQFEGEAIFVRGPNRHLLPHDSRYVLYQESIASVPARRWGERLYYGNSTAVLAVNLAAVMGAGRIELLGIDLGDAGTEHNSLDESDDPPTHPKIYMISQGLVFLASFLQKWDIEVVARCRYIDGEPQTNLRDWTQNSGPPLRAPLIFRTLPLDELE